MQYPATELAVRDWLRTQTAVLSLLSNDTRRIDVDPFVLRDSSGNDREVANVVVYRAGGAPERYLPLDTAVISADCWGGSRKNALDLQVAVTNSLASLENQALNADVFGYGAEIQSVVWLPDPGGRARYVITFLITARLAVTAA